MKVVKDFRNELLKRREVELVITSEKNPGIKASSKSIADNFKANEEAIVVKRVVSRFGRDSFSVEAFIYDSIEEKNRIEPRKKAGKKVGESPGVAS